MKVVLVYIFPLDGDQGYREKALRFVESYGHCPAGMDHDTVIVCNGAPPSDDARSIFAGLPGLTFLHHDNSGWDIGGFQFAARTVPADLMVFCGGSAYFRVPGWLERMTQVFEQLGDTLYGCTGHQGNGGGVYPHVRTTGFWCSPKLLLNYPWLVSQPGTGGQRYSFEHGENCMTNWLVSQGKTAWIVTKDGYAPVQVCDGLPGGYHNGLQENMLMGDRMTQPPYHGSA